jgi:hypothetical protein
MKLLATKLGLSDEFGGQGLIGGVEKLQGADEETRKDFLGDSQELNAAYQILVEELATAKERAAAIQAEVNKVGAGQESVLDRAVALAQADTAEQARIDRNRASIEREVANEKQLAERGMSTQAALDREMARQKEAGASGIRQYAGETAGQAAELLGADAETTARTAREGSRGFFAGLFGGVGLGAFLEAKPPAIGSDGVQPPRRRAAGQDVQPRTAPNPAGPAANQDQDLLDELRRNREASEKQTAAAERTAKATEALAANLRGPGATNAAAKSPTQRSGR